MANDEKQDSDYARLMKGEIIYRDGKRISMCCECGKIVNLDKWCGSMHFCV